MKFPTTDIQSILEPVSLQVQTFVELHSFGEKGHSIPDITEPCDDVRRHIGKLIEAGKSQANASPDNGFMQEEMPKALEPLELSSELLDQSSKLIQKDGKSSSGRSILIDACRNILFGTYKVLIVNDENNVRRLENNIKILMDSFYCVEAAKSLQEVVAFLKGVHEPFYKVIEEVNQRAKILTNKDCAIALEFHTDLLAKLLEPFVNAAKLVFLTQNDDRSSSSHMYAERCRMFFIKRIMDEFALIRKFLRLSSAGMNAWNLSEKLSIGLELQPGDENCSINENAAMIRNHLYNIKCNLLERSHNWIDNDNETDENLGFLFLNNLLSEVASLADAIEQIAGDRDSADRIRSKCDIINQTALQLSELRKNGKGSSAEARQLQQTLRHTLGQLVDLCDETCLRHISSSNGILHPLPSTMNGLLDEVRIWLQNPDYHAVTGSECLDAIIKLAWNFGRILGGDDQSVLKSKCSQLIKPMNDLVDLSQQQKGNSEEGRQLVSTLHSGIADLIQVVRSSLSQQVVNIFTDPHVSINRLVQAAKSSDGDEVFNQKLDKFQQFAKGAVVTGSQFSQLNESDDQETLQNIARCAKQLDDLIPIISSAAQLVYYSESSKRSNEESAESTKQLHNIQNLWVDTINQLMQQIDSVADLELFLESSESKIQDLLKECMTSLQNKDCRKFVENSTRVVNCLNRVRQLCEVQSKTFQDETTVQQIQQQSSNLAAQVEPFVALATAFAKNPNNPQVVVDFHETSHEILDIMSALKAILHEYFGPKMIAVNQGGDGRHYTSSLNYFITPLPAEALAEIAEEVEPEETPPPRPPPPASVTLIPMFSQPTEELPEEEEEEEVIEAPAPEEHKPILKAAHELHVEVRQWQSQGNDIIAAAKRMALLLAKMSRIVRGEEGTKIDLIETAKLIADAAMVVYKLAHEVAAECQERKIKRNLQNVAHKIPTLATQLNILSTVKATTLGGTATGSKDDIEATEMLVLNAQNIMTSVKDTVRASEAASIRIRLDSGHMLKWVRKKRNPSSAALGRSVSLLQKQQARRLIHKEANLE